MKIDNLEFKNGLFLAPMAGVTDFAFRSIAREKGADFSYTEMVSAKGLVYSFLKNHNLTFNQLDNFLEKQNAENINEKITKNLKNNENLERNISENCLCDDFCEVEKQQENFEMGEYEKMLFCAENENPSCVQIFGSDPIFMARAVKMPILQKFDMIDINMGCPAPKIIKNGDGSALLKNLNLAKEVVQSVVKNTSKPVSVKMRLGFGLSENVSLEFGRMLEETGVKMVCLHGRTREQFYSGDANLDAIANFKAKMNIPVIGNGDVFDKISYENMKKTGVDAVMIGRGALGRPWIFDEILNNFKITDIEKAFFIKKHISMLKKIYPEKFIINHMRKHLLWYVKEMPSANKYRLSLCKIQSIDEALELVSQIFK